MSALYKADMLSLSRVFSVEMRWSANKNISMVASALYAIQKVAGFVEIDMPMTWNK